MTKLSIPLVGMAFRPPASQVLAALPLGTAVDLLPEPDNQYDSNAVRVVVDMAAFPENKVLILETMLTGTGYTAFELMREGPFMLGYLAATGGKPARGGPGNIEALLRMSAPESYRAVLGAAPEGYPTVTIESIQP